MERAALDVPHQHRIHQRKHSLAYKLRRYVSSTHAEPVHSTLRASYALYLVLNTSLQTVCTRRTLLLLARRARIAPRLVYIVPNAGSSYLVFCSAVLRRCNAPLVHSDQQPPPALPCYDCTDGCGVSEPLLPQHAQ